MSKMPHGWNAFSTVCQDPERWMREGIQDQIFPMMYFRGDNFYPFALDWYEQSNGRHIAPALGTYFLLPQEGNWSFDDIMRQINFIRTNKLAGESHFRLEFLMKNTKGIYDGLANDKYLYPALQPPTTWNWQISNQGYLEQIVFKDRQGNDTILFFKGNKTKGPAFYINKGDKDIIAEWKGGKMKTFHAVLPAFKTGVAATAPCAIALKGIKNKRMSTKYKYRFIVIPIFRYPLLIFLSNALLCLFFLFFHLVIE